MQGSIPFTRLPDHLVTRKFQNNKSRIIKSQAPEAPIRFHFNHLNYSTRISLRKKGGNANRQGRETYSQVNVEEVLDGNAKAVVSGADFHGIEDAYWQSRAMACT